jgi:hypothetical protein
MAAAVLRHGSQHKNCLVSPNGKNNISCSACKICENRSRLNREETGVRDIDAYLCPDWNSLLFKLISLLSKYFSLLIHAGNLVGSGCGEGLFDSKPTPRALKFAKIPCYFPC